MSFPEGQSPLGQIYYDRAQADAECQRLCAAFYARATPEEFEVDLTDYPDFDPDSDESAITWEDLRAAGYPPPFTVQRLTAAGEEPR